MMQGILIVDKPMDWTSFDVVAKLRGVLGTRKLGHSGTLDPMATGVLPVFCGGASKAVDLQLDHTKTYCARLRLGMQTDTGDITGTVLETAPVTAGEADNRPGRAYACARIAYSMRGDAPTWRAFIEQDTDAAMVATDTHEPA